MADSPARKPAEELEVDPALRRLNLAWLLKQYYPHRWRIARLAVYTILFTAFSVSYPMFFKVLIDGILRGVTKEFLVTNALGLAGMGIGYAFFSVVCMRNRLFMNLALEKEIRTRLFGHLTRVGKDFYVRHPSGDIIERLTDELQEMTWFASSGCFRLYQIFLRILFVTGAMLALAPRLTLYVLVPLAAINFIQQRYRRQYHGLVKRVREMASDVSSAIERCFSGISVIQAFAREREQGDKFKELLDRRREAELSLIRLEAKSHALLVFMAEVVFVIVLLAGGRQVMDGVITLGILVAFNTYLAMLIYPVSEMAWFFLRIKRIEVTVERLRQYEETPLALPVAVAADGTWPAPAVEPLRRELVFDNVGYRYPGERQGGVEGISFRLAAGRRLALVGRIGAGKSTIAELLLRLYDPAAGCILWDGRNLRELDPVSLRSQVSYVPQDVQVFSDTVKGNILFGREASDERVAWAARSACLDTTLKEWQKGLEQEVGTRGVTLSGGQKQRVAVARALLGRPSVLILDDPTSFLDAHTEKELWDNLNREVPDAAFLILTHRLATVLQADDVGVLEHGRLVALGPREEILASEAFARWRAEEGKSN